MDAKTKKIAVASLSSVLLLAMVMAVAGDGSTAAHKVRHAICSSVDYKITCEKSLSDAKSSDPRELIKVVFNHAITDLQEAIKNSTLYKQAASDHRTQAALEVCEEVLDTSIDDLRRSFNRVGDLGIMKLKQYIEDIKVWLSGALTYHETCLDAFQNTTGDTGEKMKNLLHSSGMLLSNGLAMVGDISSIFSSLSLGGFTNQRILEEEGNGVDQADGEDLKTTVDGKETDAAGPPPFVDAEARRIMTANVNTLKPSIVVAQDGSGQFKTIKGAISSLPKKGDGPYVIHVKAGLYKENVIFPKKVNNVVLIGDGPLKTRISGNKNYVDGVQTFHTAVLAVNADGFIAKDIGIENTAGPTKHQAVAVRVSADRAIFFNVHMDGFQDTLYAHTYRQYYRDCTITGTIDFIFGDAAAVFQNCQMIVRKPMENQACMVTAQGRKERHSTGATVLQNCHIMAEPAFLSTVPPLKAYLGRPWKELSRTIIMQSLIDGFIAPEGGDEWVTETGIPYVPGMIPDV
ncbi:UNVERIFIED_CONTAM: putative pectinesterase/pectinesterase inhibitor 28 [Sesamum calycinum]|uniref:Pectinesterase n=1 Tax=Sesamum calycinum TaxID=2727403 RepID=A0AAW2R8Y0_9LAMI